MLCIAKAIIIVSLKTSTKLNRWSIQKTKQDKIKRLKEKEKKRKNKEIKGEMRDKGKKKKEKRKVLMRRTFGNYC